jgi:hypothetical protein
LPAPPAQSRTVFVAVGAHAYPSPFPPPVFLGRDPSNGFLVYGWAGRRWGLSPPPPNNPYSYLCVVNGGLKYCWNNPPNGTAHSCTRRSDGQQGWCWEE